MKRLIICLLLVFVVCPSVGFAQDYSSLTASQRQSLIAQIQAQLLVLYQELAQMLAQQQTITTTLQTQGNQIAQIQQQTTTILQNQTPVVNSPVQQPPSQPSPQCVENPQLTFNVTNKYVASTTVAMVGNVVDTIDTWLTGTYSTGCPINKNTIWTLTHNSQNIPPGKGTILNGWPLIFWANDPGEGSPVGNSGTDILYNLRFEGNLRYDSNGKPNVFPITSTLTVGNVSKQVTVAP